MTSMICRPETERSEMFGTVSNMPIKTRKEASDLEREEPTKDDETDSAPKAVIPPDGGWGWMVLLGTMTVNIVVIGHGKSFGVYFKNLMEEFDASPSRVAWLQSLQISMFSFLWYHNISKVEEDRNGAKKVDTRKNSRKLMKIIPRDVKSKFQI